MVPEQEGTTMDAGFPAFEAQDVALLISAVERALADLRQANERAGGNDAEFPE